VGRVTTDLDAEQVRRAVIESVAENSVDAVVAPIFWARLGAPAVFAYRAINTMDAMVGHRTDRYRRFGWASAQADDLVNYFPARLSVLALVGVRPVVRDACGAPCAATHPSTRRRTEGSSRPRSLARSTCSSAGSTPTTEASRTAARSATAGPSIRPISLAQSGFVATRRPRSACSSQRGLPTRSIGDDDVRRLLAIGIGAGDPDLVTVQAVRALNEVDVFLVLDKGDSAVELMRAREHICQRGTVALADLVTGGDGHRDEASPDPCTDRDRSIAVRGLPVPA
jgi:hypothetical protein